jgi:hypothetical protein
MAKINVRALTAAQRKNLAKQKAQNKEATAAKNREAAQRSNQARASQTAAQQVEEARQYVAANKAKQEDLSKRLSSGEYKSPETFSEDTPSSSAVTTNTSYHDALHAIVSDLRQRTGDVYEYANTLAAKSLETKAKSLGLRSRDELRTKAGNRIGIGSVRARTQTLKKIAAPTYLLDQAAKHLTNSHGANQAGDVFTTGESFSKAGDAVIAFLRHTDRAFSKTNAKGQKIYDRVYGDLFRDPKHGDPQNELRVHQNSHQDVQTIVNGYADHITEQGLKSQRIQNPEVAARFNSADEGIRRDYSLITKKGKERSDEEVAPSVSLPAAYTVKTEAEKTADAQTRALARQQRQRTNAQEKGRTFAIKASTESDSLPSDVVESYTSPTGPNKTTTHFNDFQLRWKRSQVQEKFEKEETKNKASAAAAGQSYTKKAFTGSDAWENPDKWHTEHAIKQHWLASSRANKPENFESSDAKLDPVGYVKRAEESGKPVRTKLEPTDAQYKSWAMNTVLSPKGSNFESKLFPAEEGGKGDKLTATTMLPFLPNSRESRNAEKENQSSVPEDVNKRQIARSRRQAFGLSLGTTTEDIKDESTGKVIGTKRVGLTDQEDLKTPVKLAIPDKEALSPEPEPATSNAAEESAPSSSMTTRSLNTFFNDGGKK